MYIDGCYTTHTRDAMVSLLEELQSKVANLEGFVMRESAFFFYKENAKEYFSADKNLFINWGMILGTRTTSGLEIMLGVVQEEPVSSLKMLTGQVIPPAVALFNYLSPTIRISRRTVTKLVSLARKSEANMPVLGVR